jgi:hypothetical protein
MEFMTGGVVSTTVTFELQLLVLLDASLTWHVNGVIPSGNLDPEGGTQVGAPTPGQLSDTTGLRVTGVPVGPVHSTVGVGHEIFGNCLSSTVTLAVQVLVTLSGSVTVSVTGLVVPSG